MDFTTLRSPVPKINRTKMGIRQLALINFGKEIISPSTTPWMVIHAIPAYKKRSYKKRLVDILWCKKRRLVDFLAVRNAFLRQLFKINEIRNDSENFSIIAMHKNIILYIMVQLWKKLELLDKNLVFYLIGFSSRRVFHLILHICD